MKSFVYECELQLTCNMLIFYHFQLHYGIHTFLSVGNHIHLWQSSSFSLCFSDFLRTYKFQIVNYNFLQIKKFQLKERIIKNREVFCKQRTFGLHIACYW